MQALYRFYNSDSELLYIGISRDLPSRLRSHGSSSPFWAEVATIKLEWFETRKEVAKAEREAIKAEHPIWNKHYNERLPKHLDERYRGWCDGPPNVVEIAAAQARGESVKLGPTMKYVRIRDTDKQCIVWDDGYECIIASVETSPEVWTAKREAYEVMI